MGHECPWVLGQERIHLEEFGGLPGFGHDGSEGAPESSFLIAELSMPRKAAFPARALAYPAA